MVLRDSLVVGLVVALASFTSIARAQNVQCPPGQVAIGGVCEVEERPSAAPAQDPLPQRSYGQQGYTQQGYNQGEPQRDYGTHPDVGLIVAGSIVLGLGYAAQVIFGVLGNNPILYIPVVGGFIHAPLNGTGGGIALGLGVSASQTLGLIFLIWGAAAHHPNEAPTASLEPEIVPGPGLAGLGLRWRF